MDIAGAVCVAVVVLVAGGVHGPPEEGPAGDAGLGPVVAVTAGCLPTDVTE